MIKEYSFKFDDLAINQNEIAFILGYRNSQLPDPFGDYIKMALDDVRNLTDIKGAYQIIEKSRIDQQNFILHADSHEFEVGKAVCKELKGAEQLAFYVCTAGKTISDKSANLLYGEDPVLGYIYDVLGNMITEAACDLMQSFLETNVRQHGKLLTNRYSPGYCQWSVADQHKLFASFPENICGISLSDSALMTPVKSVSGVIGIGKYVRFKEYICTLCSSKDCIYRKIKNKMQTIEN